MARKKGKDSEKLYRMGLGDPRSGPERFAGALTRATRSRAIRAQDRRYDDSAEKMARNIRAADEDRKRRGESSSRPRATKKATKRRGK